MFKSGANLPASFRAWLLQPAFSWPDETLLEVLDWILHPMGHGKLWGLAYFILSFDKTETEDAIQEYAAPRHEASSEQFTTDALPSVKPSRLELDIRRWDPAEAASIGSNSTLEQLSNAFLIFIKGRRFLRNGRKPAGAAAFFEEYRKKQLRGPKTIPLPPDWDIPVFPPTDDPLANDLHDCIENLNLYRRKIILMHYFLDLPVAIIANELGKKEGAIRVALHHARHDLGDCLSRKGWPPQ